MNIYLNADGIFNQTGGNLNYTTFYHQGGEVQGSLVNQSVYIYDSGSFNGRLLNYGAGTVTFNADFTAGNGLAHHSTNPITLADRPQPHFQRSRFGSGSRTPPLISDRTAD